MNKTQIEWALNPDGSPGYTFNPITGCLNNCPYCYARKLANTRLKERYLANTCLADGAKGGVAKITIYGQPTVTREEDYANPFYPRFWEDKITELIIHQWRKPRGVFVCDMSDLFGIGIPFDWTSRVMGAIKRHPESRFYLLTKQPQNLIKFSPFPDNAWVGVSATNFKMFHSACYHLDGIEAKVKYISCEPLQERLVAVDEIIKAMPVNWVIIGSQTKPYKPPKIEWVKEIVQACDKAGIPVFLKNNLFNCLPLDGGNFYQPVEDGDHYQLRQEMPK